MKTRETNKHVFMTAVWVCLLAMVFLFAEETLAKSEEPADVPLIRLIAVPEKYNGVLVRTIGFVRLEFEGKVMYPHRDDYEYSLVGNGVWININEKDLKQEASTYVMKYCLIVGTFDARDRGHMGLCSGSLNNIKRFEVWSDPTFGSKRGESLLMLDETRKDQGDQPLKRENE